jgi:transposase-like protein
MWATGKAHASKGKTMSRSTISTFQLFALFPDEETARVYLEDRLWPKGPVCPDCKSGERVSALGACATRKAGFYRCLACAFDFTIRTNTIFERSKVPLHKWLYSMYLLVTARKGISSLQLGKEIGVTQKTAWFILGRLREACGGPDGPLDKLRGTVEIDEAFFGGKEANKHEWKKQKLGRGPVGKTAVLGMRERGGRTRAKVVEIRTIQGIQDDIHANVEVGSQLYTDDHVVFNDLDGLFFRHESVNHSAGEYARGPASTNSIESVWAVLKRGLHGVYHHASKKHLFRYVDEFTFRLNEGNVENHTVERLNSFVDATAGKRLTYERLTA